MYAFGNINITPIIPEKLKLLKNIAYNLWWSWNSDATNIFKEIDTDLWESCNNNPIYFLNRVSSSTLKEKSNDVSFMEKYDSLTKKFSQYTSKKDTWFNKTYPDKHNSTIAYFSAEYGLSEILPIYSGGLGVLSGDHCKSASDLGLPFVAIGLFYKQGYFNQRITSAGEQGTEYFELNINELPLFPVFDTSGELLHIGVEIAGQTIYAKLWKVVIGRVTLYLLDTDTLKNSEEDRLITARLYGGGKETRIKQEMLLGIGGVKALNALGIHPDIYHQNEGHSAFLGLELLRSLVEEKNLSFETAKEIAASSLLFTTHTPVPAGNDVFHISMIEKYFFNFWEKLNINKQEFLNLGISDNDNQNFNMTILALNLSGKSNGVSEIHGIVSRKIYENLWSDIPVDEIPIQHITNGIHVSTWLSCDFKELFAKYFDDNFTDIEKNSPRLNKLDIIPSEEIWSTHNKLKEKMIFFLRNLIKQQKINNNEPLEKIQEVNTLLDPNVLTIGFARRFATYKRADLIFRDLNRIQKILNNASMPVQIIFAGKAHPDDKPAQEIIKYINSICNQPEFKGRVVLIENYNMNIAKYLISGVDIWLNNPRKPLEASGTSGQKSAINGVLNFSVLDGWWYEGYNGNNGWSIGTNSISHENDYLQDNYDSNSLYDNLENIIIPMYYNRTDNIPLQWIDFMKNSIKSLSFEYSSDRMVKDYTKDIYIPLIESHKRLSTSNYELAVNLSQWKNHIKKTWEFVKFSRPQILNDIYSNTGNPLKISTYIDIDELEPSDLNVELYYYKTDNTIISDVKIQEMEFDYKDPNGVCVYSTDIAFDESGNYKYTFRLIPYNPDLLNKFSLRLIKWMPL